MYIILYYNGFPEGLWRRVLERKKSELVPAVGTYIKMRVCVWCYRGDYRATDEKNFSNNTLRREAYKTETN